MGGSKSRSASSSAAAVSGLAGASHGQTSSQHNHGAGNKNRHPKIPSPQTTNSSSITVNASTIVTELFVLFGVKGSRITLELAQIDVSQHKNSESGDEAFFSSVRAHYKTLRGTARYWFSIWQLKYCDFVEV